MNQNDEFFVEKLAVQSLWTGTRKGGRVLGRGAQRRARDLHSQPDLVLLPLGALVIGVPAPVCDSAKPARLP